MAFIMAYHTILFIINLQLVKHLLEQRLMVKEITIHINSRQFKEKMAVTKKYKKLILENLYWLLCLLHARHSHLLLLHWICILLLIHEWHLYLRLKYLLLWRLKCLLWHCR